MLSTFSSTEAYDEGMLEAGDGTLMSWEVRGNPDGKPVLIVHGGPGAGRPAGTPKSFDPQRYRIILFDQRGCGRSLPHAGDPSTDLTLNTTEHLLRDMEQLRDYLGVQKWLLFGGSWGAALSLAYAERHPDRVTELILPAFWTMSRTEVDWLYRGGVAPVFPEQWHRFCGVVDETSADPVPRYVELLASPDAGVRTRAAERWTAWEDAVLSLEPHGRPAHYSEQAPDDLIAFARISAHYAINNGWWDDQHLLTNIHRLTGIPGVIIHGQHDLSCPLVTAWEFALAWPDAELIVIDDAGHRGSPAMNAQVRAAIDRYAGLRSPANTRASVVADIRLAGPITG